MVNDNGSLWAALAAFQAEAPTLAKDGVNPHFKSKFTTLDTIVNTVRPILAKHNLAYVSQPAQDENGKPTLKYTLAHGPSGEQLNGEMPLLLGKQTPQDLGSAITYARRYSMTAVLNLVADEDDDGHQASQQPKPKVEVLPAAQRTWKASVYAKADEHNIGNGQLANVVLALMKQEPREFADEKQAGDFASRALDRLPIDKYQELLRAISEAA